MITVTNFNCINEFSWNCLIIITSIHFHHTDDLSSHHWNFIYLISFHLSNNFLSLWWIFNLLIAFRHINGFSSNLSILMRKNDINHLDYLSKNPGSQIWKSFSLFLNLSLGWALLSFAELSHSLFSTIIQISKVKYSNVLLVISIYHFF